VVKNPAAFRQPITEDEATEILVLDVAKAEKAVLRLITVPLSDGQFDALVSFTFNLGSGALQRSTLRRKVNREDHAEVPAEFLRWVWAGGKKLKGLIRRREAEAALYQT
jgi:lysozyme